MRSQARNKSEVVAGFRRTQILDAARDCFTRAGVADTTVADIARAAKLAKGTLYLYYRSKDDILRELLNDDLDDLRDHTIAAIQADAPLDARLQGFVAATLEFYDRKRNFIEHCQLELSPEVRRKVRAFLGECFDRQVAAWSEVLRANVRGAAPAPREANARAWQIVSLARGLAQHRLAGWTPGTIDDIAARAARLLSKGLTSR